SSGCNSCPSASSTESARSPEQPVTAETMKIPMSKMAPIRAKNRLRLPKKECRAKKERLTKKLENSTFLAARRHFICVDSFNLFLNFFDIQFYRCSHDSSWRSGWVV